MLSYHEAQTMMARAQDRGYGARRKLQNNTYLHARSNGDYAVRLHSTDVVTIHADGTYSLNTGGWETVTTKDRINNYGPARVYSHRGTWAVMHSDDPHMPTKIQKCRTCKGTGEVTIDDWGQVRYYSVDTSRAAMHLSTDGYTYPCDAWSLDFERRYHADRAPLPLQRYSGGRTHFLRDQPEHTTIVGQVRTWRSYSVIGHHQATCNNCGGTRVADYGSQPRHVAFYDGIRVDSYGRVTDPTATRIPELPEEKAARRAAERRAAEQAARARKRAEAAARKRARNARPAWLAEHGLALNADGRTVTLVKAVNGDLSSLNGTMTSQGRQAIRYEIGSTVTAPDYTSDPSCGHGLHFSPTAQATRQWVSGDRFLACAVDYASMVVVGSKVKAKSCTVLYEVALDGRRIQHTAWDDLPAGTAGRD
jgi:hypothetical protein